MTIDVADIEKGFLYKTENNQERVVLGHDDKGEVVYAARGRNVLNKFDTRFSCQPERFTEACEERLQKINSEMFEKIIDDCNARNILAFIDSSHKV